MFNINKILGICLIFCSILTISGCETGSKKNEEKKALEQKSQIADENQKQKNDLLVKANQEIVNINQKLTVLNDKIHAYHEKGRKLSEAQNKEIDEIEKLRGSLNPRIHQINDISGDEWENFKTTLEKDLEEVKTSIDLLITELEKK
jgi:small-conductance mechanosensitive channel